MEEKYAGVPIHFNTKTSVMTHEKKLSPMFLSKPGGLLSLTKFLRYFNFKQINL